MHGRGLTEPDWIINQGDKAHDLRPKFRPALCGVFGAESFALDGYLVHSPSRICKMPLNPFKPLTYISGLLTSFPLLDHPYDLFVRKSRLICAPFCLADSTQLRGSFRGSSQYQNPASRQMLHTVVRLTSSAPCQQVFQNNAVQHRVIQQALQLSLRLLIQRVVQTLH